MALPAENWLWGKRALDLRPSATSEENKRRRQEGPGARYVTLREQWSGARLQLRTEEELALEEKEVIGKYLVLGTSLAMMYRNHNKMLREEFLRDFQQWCLPLEKTMNPAVCSRVFAGRTFQGWMQEKGWFCTGSVVLRDGKHHRFARFTVRLQDSRP